MENKIDEKTLKNLQELNSQFNTIKNQLGDLELQKHGLCLKVESLRGEFQVLEASLAERLKFRPKPRDLPQIVHDMVDWDHPFNKS